MMQRKYIIIGSVCGLALIGLAIYGATHQQSSTPQQQATYTDPNNGKQIIDNAPYKQSSVNNPDPQRPTFISFTDLTDQGLSQDQLDQVENAIYSYSSQKSLGFTEVSLIANSIQTTPPGSTDPGYYIHFSFTVNRKTTYYAEVTYTDFSSCTTKLFTADKQTLLFTQ